ncbi:MAG: sulfate/thiosulfate transport system substrate-binding protein [Actinomycetota bacterium]|jgi:sulfate/thiosulfate-binding protein|nr:sulfate/thiosulfate transport system substrate-binding protein [Actinomycetota bacterium]MDQ1668180.1 sulfate/thiosulfate transport system substrate-binding protein [Actinomycetota bacterium]
MLISIIPTLKVEKGVNMEYRSGGGRLALVAAGLVATLGLAACASTDAAAPAASSGASNQEVTLSLVAYSTPQAAYEKIIAAFQKTDAGKNVKFSQSYGASGDQSRAVESGLPADFVMFSLETDMTRLTKAGIVADDWNSDANKGILTDSVVALVTRKGNPKGIKSFADLTKPGVDVITPNPFSSGGARWNIMAVYGSQTQAGKSEAQAAAFLTKTLKNVSVQDDSARAALQTFTGGKGDVLISYENEAIFAQQNGQDIDYVVPDSTLLIENPAAVTKNSKHPKEAKAFLDYVHSPEAQKIFTENGYRPVADGGDTAGQDFPKPSGLFTIADLGGWAAVATKYFDVDKGIVTDIERKLGVSVEKK